MTVENTVYFTGWQNANGSNKNWAYAFHIPSDDSVLILVRDTSNPAVITEYRSDFTRVEVDDNNGTIVFPVSVAALGATKQVRIVRDVPYTQMTQIGMEGAFNPEIHENALDKLTMLAQQLYGAAERSLRFPLGDTVTELPSVRAGKVLAFDDNGNPIAGPTPGEISNAASYATAAMGYRDQAEGYKNAATTQAGIATTKAAEAAASAQDAADIAASLDLNAYLSKAGNLAGLASVTVARNNLGLGSAAIENAGTGANQLLKLGADGKLPAVDGSQLLGLSAVDPGMIGYTAEPNPPAGWLERNGAAISRTAYAALFARIGTIFGTGDGSTTFNLPDARGTFDRGWDRGRGYDPGRAFGSYQADMFGSHSHTIYSTGSGGGDSKPATGNGRFPEASPTSVAGGSETRPKNVAYLPIIKY